MEQGREVLDQIRERIDIVSLVSRYIELKRAGRNYSARCPFHNEKTGSFIVSPDIQRYKCFGCGKSGDIFTFVMEYEHVDFVEALEKLAKEAGIKLVKRFNPESKKYAILEMINSLSADFFHNKLEETVGKQAKDYLTGRGLDQQMITRFNLGYSHGDGSLVSYLRTKANFTNEQLLESGLFVIKDSSNRMREKFFKRVMFPIQNDRGKVIAFSGRVMPGNDLGPKYLNSPDTPIFHKKNGVYGVFQAKTEIRKNDLCILCEGQTDVIACHKAGYANIVAPLGTALTDEQVTLIKRFSQNVLLLFDNDSAGQMAVERGFMLCSKQDFNIFANNTGQFKDIDEMLQKDPTAMTRLIEGKQDAFTYLITSKLENLDLSKYVDNRAIVSFVNRLIQSVPDASKRNFYLEKAVNITGLQPTSFNINPAAASQNSNLSPFDGLKTPADAKKHLSPEEYYLFLIAHTGNYDHLKTADLSCFTDEYLRNVLELLKSSEKPIKDIIHEIEDKTRLEAILLSNFKDVTPTKEEFNNVYARIVQAGIKYKLAKLRRQLSIEENRAYPDIMEEKVDQLSKEITELSAKLTQLKKG